MDLKYRKWWDSYVKGIAFVFFKERFKKMQPEISFLMELNETNVKQPTACRLGQSFLFSHA